MSVRENVTLTLTPATDPSANLTYQVSVRDGVTQPELLHRLGIAQVAGRGFVGGVRIKSRVRRKGSGVSERFGDLRIGRKNSLKP